MKTAMRNLGHVVASVAALVLGAGSVLLHLVHPEWTETQLFLGYWWFWVGGVVVVAMGLVIAEVSHD